MLQTTLCIVNLFSCCWCYVEGFFAWVLSSPVCHINYLRQTMWALFVRRPAFVLLPRCSSSQLLCGSTWCEKTLKEMRRCVRWVTVSLARVRAFLELMFPTDDPLANWDQRPSLRNGLRSWITPWLMMEQKAGYYC